MTALEMRVAALRAEWPVGGMSRETFTELADENAALRAHVERLREALVGLRASALTALVSTPNDSAWASLEEGFEVSGEALAATPAQSLADVERRVVKGCAAVCSNRIGTTLVPYTGGPMDELRRLLVGALDEACAEMAAAILALAPEVTP